MKRATCMLAVLAVLVLPVQGAKVTNVGPEAAAAQAFRSLDKNRDGALTADELEAEIFASAHASVTCTYHACPEGFRMKPGAAEIVGNNDLDCCDKTCQAQSCSRTGFRLRPDASQVLATASAECCEKTCGGFECPNGWKARSNPDQIVQPSQEVCCLKTCELHVCNAEHDLTLRGDAALTAGSTEDDCCVRTCRSYTCSQDGYLLRKDAADITGGVGGNSEAACCAKSCALFSCVGKFTLVDSAANIVGESAEVCCQRFEETEVEEEGDAGDTPADFFAEE